MHTSLSHLQNFPALIPGLPQEFGQRLQQELSGEPTPQLLRVMCQQYTYYICRALESWGRMVEFRVFSAACDAATLGYARIANVLRNAPPDIFPSLEEIYPATEALCCYLFKLSSQDRVLAASLMPEIERRVFQHEILAAALEKAGTGFSEYARFFQRYSDIAPPFFQAAFEMWASEENQRDHLQDQNALISIIELADIFALELQQAPHHNLR